MHEDIAFDDVVQEGTAFNDRGRIYGVCILV